MRKFTLLLSFVVLAGLTFGQVAVNRNVANEKVQDQQKQMKKGTPKSTVIWSEDFDGARWRTSVNEDEQNGYVFNPAVGMPEGWAVFDGNEAAYYWHWSDVGPRGANIGNPGAFDPNQNAVNRLPGSRENGFIMLESDYWNTTENGVTPNQASRVEMDSYIEFGPIDLSGNPYVQISYNQVFVYCCLSTNTLSLFISNDYDPANPNNGHWVEFDSKGGTLANVWTPVDQRHQSFNITKVAGGKSQVYFRFKQSGTYAWHYCWLIDDIVLSVPPVNDLIVTDSWNDYIYPATTPQNGWDASEYFSGGYTSIPAQVTNDFVSFRASVNNFGSAQQEFKSHVFINKDGAKVYEQDSPTLNLKSGSTDTAKIETVFTPTEIGFYQVSGSLVMNSGDEDPTNNNFGYDFEISENKYSRVYESNSSTYGAGGPADFADGGANLEAIAQPFDLPEGSGTIKLAGLRFYFYDYMLNESGYALEIEAIKAGTFNCIAKVWAGSSIEGDNLTSFVTSQMRIMTEDDFGKWIYMSFEDEGNLYISPDDYPEIYVGLELYHSGTLDDHLYWVIGTDRYGTKQPFNGGVSYIAGGQNPSWAAAQDNFAIDLYLDEMPNLFYNVDMNAAITAGTFNPDADKVYVTGSFNGWVEPGKGGSIELFDGDGDGFYSAQITVDKNTEIQYKYFINAGWTKGEWDGDPNRTATVVDDIYTTDDVFGVKPDIAVKENNLAAVKVYPNPFNNQVIIENAADVSKVTISNVLGQTMMVKTNLLDKEYISTATFATGVYLITVTDNNNNSKTLRIVKQ